MIISCTSCGSKYKYDEAKLEGVLSKKVKCPKCKTVIEVFNPMAQPPKTRPSMSLPEFDPLEETHSTAAKKVDTKPAHPAPKPSLVTQPMPDDTDAPSTA